MKFDPLAVIFEANPHAGLPPSEQAFRRRVDECAAWAAEHGGALPNKRSADPEERRHGSFLDTWRQVKSGRSTGAWNACRQTYLDECIPGWEDPRFAGFVRRVNECAAWIAVHGGRLPNMKSSSPIESRLGQFLNSQRQAKNGTSEGVWEHRRRAYLDECIPGWEDPRLAGFVRRVDECAEWMSAHNGVFPSVKSCDPIEKRHGQFITKQRRVIKNDPTRDARRREYLNDKIPGWEDPVFARFVRRVDECAEWMSAHSGVFPSIKSLDPIEKRHGQFLRGQRQSQNGSAGGAWDARRQAYLDDRVPGWDDPWFVTFIWNAFECVSWIAAHDGTLPSSGSVEETEKRHGLFLVGQRRAKNGTAKRAWDARRQAYLEEHIPDWDDPAVYRRRRNRDAI